MEVTQESGHEQGKPCDGWVLGSSPPSMHFVGVFTLAVCALPNIYIYQVPPGYSSILANDTVGSSNILTGGSTILFLKIPYETTFETAENPLHYDVEDTLHVVTHYRYKGAT